MPDLCLDIAIYLAVFLLGILVIGWIYLDNWVHRMFWTCSQSCLYIWSGFGAAYDSVSSQYRWSYVLFAISLAVAFFVVLRFTGPLAERFYARTKQGTEEFFGRKSYLVFAVAIHLLGNLLALTYPEFNLHRLLAPPASDLMDSYDRNVSEVISGSTDVCTKLIRYVTVLASPFYLMAAYQFRKRYLVLALFLAVPLYISYCADCYLGRGAVLSRIGIFVLVLWFDNVRARKYLVLGSLAILPVVATALHEYQAIRLGGDAEKVAWHESLLTMLQDETSFPLDADTVIDSDVHPDLGKYFVWLFTLPVPKILTGTISTSRINYEITHILLNQDVDQQGGYIRLAGLVTESIYVFGSCFFWVHAVFLGSVMAVMCRIFERHTPLLIVMLSVIFTFSYDLNRAGVAAAMPSLINNHLVLFWWFAYLNFHRSTATDCDVAERLYAARMPYSLALRQSHSKVCPSSTISPARARNGTSKP